MGLKKNILYSGILSTSVYVFQFITYPYVARVLGVSNIGICNYVQSIVQYFTLFAMLGISTLGVREIAKCNGDRTKLDDTFSKLFLLNLSSTLIITLIYILAISILPQFIPYKKLLIIGASQIFFGAFTIEWLFRGLENFKYITIRSLFVRIGYVASIFTFVHDENDYFTYFIIYTFMCIANSVINWEYRRKFVRLSFQPLNSIKKYIKPYFYLGSQLILTSLYTTFNTVYLGMICGDNQVGYYTTATKIENVVLALFSSVTLVIMPRISSMIENKNQEGVNKVIMTSIELLFALVFPCLVFIECFSEGIVSLIAGSGYEGAVLPMRIVMPAILIVGLEQILIVQILMPNRADKQVFINSILGAGCSIVLNLFLVSRLQSVGSSIVWIVSEILVLISAIHFVYKKQYITINIGKHLLSYILCFLPLLVCLLLLQTSSIAYWIIFSLGGILTIVYSHVFLKYIIKNSSYQNIYSIIINNIRKCIKI